MKTTFWNILSNQIKGIDIPNGILIPKIQRDYAQGRATVRAEEIRNDFLDNIRKAIIDVKRGQKDGLDLDFVYGTNDLGSFIPLDGQQRLTTLFLIHWYLVFKEQKINQYVNELSKFHYETRPSSNLFLRCLCQSVNDSDFRAIFNTEKSFKEILKNKNWYYSAWNQDNTIQGMIVMLDSIHDKFKNSGIAFDDLVNDDKQPITFNFLQLNTFGMSDSLYIKMNARGKQLTSFENLKAQLAKFIKESSFNNGYDYFLETSNGNKKVDVETYFVTRVDTIWSDYFWKMRDKENKFDDKLLKLLTFISLNEMILVNKDNYDLSIKALEKTENISYYLLNNFNLLNENCLISYIDILDIICAENSVAAKFFKESNFIENIVKPIFDESVKADYERRIIFYGIFKFVLENNGELKFEELQKWSRLLHNLAINTSYDDSKDFLSSLKGINSFIEKYDGDMYSDFINHSITGFDTIQIKEELIKHHLKAKSNDWVELIDSIENHGFLEGQIISLLVFSGIYQSYQEHELSNLSTDKLEFLYQSLKEKSKVFNTVFTNLGLHKFEEEEFRRALLTFGDYAIYSTNWFFYNSSKHRDLSWKRLLKETANKGENYKSGAEAIIKLFDELTASEDVSKQFKKFIKNYLSVNKEKDWKHYFIKYPLMFQSSIKHYVKFYGEASEMYIYCLNKTKYNREVDYDFMSLVLISELNKKGVNLDNIEFEYQSKYDQFGISKINGKSVKILYNTPLNKHVFTIKKYREDEYYVKSLNEVIDYIINN